MSVRDLSEAREAIAGGASILDIKEPQAGPLGRASHEVMEAVAGLAGLQDTGGVSVSAALGDLDAREDPRSFPVPRGVAFFKLGLAGWGGRAAWDLLLDRWRERLEDEHASLVAVAYADWKSANAPEPNAILAHAESRELKFLLVDTFVKRGRTLRDALPDDDLALLIARAHGAGLRIALAGSLSLADIAPLCALGPDVIAVRGAACGEGGRLGTVQATMVSLLSQALATQKRRPS